MPYGGGRPTEYVRQFRFGDTGRGGGVRDRLRVVLRAVALLATVVGITAACADGDGGAGSQWPPAAAGRACQFLNYDIVAETIGVRFDTAGGASKDETYSCALTQAENAFPDLTLAVTETEADEVIFIATMIPSGATRIADLGRVGYRIGFPSARGAGPGIEVGWLSTYGRLMIMRFTLPAGTTSAEVQKFIPKLVALAKTIEAKEILP
jgi:hypothetical protein